MNDRTYLIQDAASVSLREPTPYRWYFGANEDGSTGALAQWDGFAFVSSLSDNHDMTQYHHLQEQPPKA